MRKSSSGATIDGAYLLPRLEHVLTCRKIDMYLLKWPVNSSIIALMTRSMAFYRGSKFTHLSSGLICMRAIRSSGWRKKIENADGEWATFGSANNEFRWRIEFYDRVAVGLKIGRRLTRGQYRSVIALRNSDVLVSHLPRRGFVTQKHDISRVSGT